MISIFDNDPKAEYKRRLELIVRIAGDYGGIDGDHHKQYALDQILRAALGSGYEQWRFDYEEIDQFGEPTYVWDEGIPA